MQDDLTLIVGGLRLSGWNSIRVTRGIERLPNDFELAMTEHFPGELDFTVTVGDGCQVFLGGDQVIDGYVDRYVPSISGNSHGVQVSGRGRSCDLVDCAAEWPGGQISASSALGVAQKLCEPYQLTATCLSDPGPPIPKRVLNNGETAFDIIEQVCRYAALLAYEGTDGNLILNRVTETQHAASGFTQGMNVKFAGMSYSVDQQYSDYQVVRMAMDNLQDAGDGGNLISIVKNPNIRRHRLRIIVAESGDPGSEIALKRAAWECNRRWGRSAVLRLTTDSWRDAAGALYEPNTLVEIDLPSLKKGKVTWLISEVTYRRDEHGTACDLVIMPPSAFAPEPILLQPSAADVPFLPVKS